MVSYRNKVNKNMVDMVRQIRNGDFKDDKLKDDKLKQTCYLMNQHLDPDNKDTPAAEATNGLNDYQLKRLWSIIRNKKCNVDRGTSKMDITLVNKWYQYLGEQYQKKFDPKWGTRTFVDIGQ